MIDELRALAIFAKVEAGSFRSAANALKKTLYSDA